LKTCKITAIIDGSPGHEKQTEGIIRALEKYVPVEITYLKIKKSFLSDSISWLKAFVGLCWKSGKTENVDFVIGTGTHTHPHVIRIGNAGGAKKILCMSPASFLTKVFDLCFVPTHDRINPGKNIFLTMGPPNISENKNMHKKDKGLVLIGGQDDKSHVWDSDKILGYIKEIVSSNTGNMNWTISSSPRTPVEMENKIDRFVAGMEKVSFFRFSDTKKGWVENQYDASCIAWVTADSMSMIYEALTAGCTTCIIPMEWKQKENKFSFSEQDLYENQLALPYDKWILKREYFEYGKSINESDKCAREILRRWCPENLQ